MNAPETEESPQSARRGLARFAPLAPVILVALIAGAAAVYFKGSWQSNGVSLATIDCAGAPGAAKRLAPLAKGEVAAFQVATAADGLTDLAFKGPDGANVTLAAFSGRAVLVNLWATWCVPCRTEMPALDRLEAALGSDKFQVVAIDLDLGDQDRARAFLEGIGVKELAFYADPTTGLLNTLKKRGLALGLPTTFLVDGRGCRLGVLEGPAAWDSDDAKALVAAATASG